MWAICESGACVPVVALGAGHGMGVDGDVGKGRAGGEDGGSAGAPLSSLCGAFGTGRRIGQGKDHRGLPWDPLGHGSEDLV